MEHIDNQYYISYAARAYDKLFHLEQNRYRNSTLMAIILVQPLSERCHLIFIFNAFADVISVVIRP